MSTAKGESAKFQRVVRTETHHTLPNIVGRWFPRNDDPEIQSYYSACMLVLLKPWRDLQRDLKSPADSWPVALALFVDSHDATKQQALRSILGGIQYFHECLQAAQASRSNNGFTVTDVPISGSNHRCRRAADDAEFYENEDLPEVEALQSEEGLAALLEENLFTNEAQHAAAAVEIGKLHNIFPREQQGWHLTHTAHVLHASGGTVERLDRWRRQMERDKAIVNGITVEPAEDVRLAPTADVQRIVDVPMQTDEVGGVVTPILPEVELDAVDPSELRPDQRRAYDIMKWHLDKVLNGEDPPPLWMVLHGEGGTGKSKVIQTVTEYFASRHADHLLVKGAYTGVAASLIGGKTLHTLAALPREQSRATAPLADTSKQRLEAFYLRRLYLLVDECSMLAKTILAIMSRNVSIARGGSDTFRDGSFGGMSVILCGDFHQFPPVATKRAEFLYTPTTLARDSEVNNGLRAAGRQIYEEFRTVVVLKDQMRIKDDVWRDLLRALRNGRMEPEHITC